MRSAPPNPVSILAVYHVSCVSAMSLGVSRVFINNMLEDSSKQILMVQGH